jgi:hypothetical protein
MVICDHKYNKIKKLVNKTNCVVINSITIAGEGINGIFSWFICLSNLYRTIENDLYSPYYYRYMVGISSGSIIIALILNVRYLYENFGKKIALNYMDALYDNINYNNIKDVFLDIGNKQGSIFTVYKLFENLWKTGALFVRDDLVKFLNGNLKGFNNDKNYFKSNHYNNWLTENLKYVFIGVYSQNTTLLYLYSGNEYFPSNCLFNKYEKLTSENFQEILLASSAINVVYESKTNFQVDSPTDVAITHININEVLQTIILATYHLNNDFLYKKMLDFFDIKTNNFLIIHNKFNIQDKFEIFEIYKNTSDIPIINTIKTYMLLNERLKYFAKYNIAATTILVSQPFLNIYSVNNFNNFTPSIYMENRKNILSDVDTLNEINKKGFNTQIPTIKISNKIYDKLYKDEFKNYKAYMKQYNKYSSIVSNLVSSTFLYDLKSPFQYTTSKKTKINVNLLYLDIFMRNLLELDINAEIKMFFNIDAKNISQDLNNYKNLGVIYGNIWYDTVKKQQYTALNIRKLDISPSSLSTASTTASTASSTASTASTTASTASTSTNDLYDLNTILKTSITRDVNITNFD